MNGGIEQMDQEDIERIKKMKYFKVKSYLKELGARPKSFPEHAGKGQYWHITIKTDKGFELITFPLPYYNKKSDQNHMLDVWETLASGFKKIARKRNVSVSEVLYELS